MDDSCAVCAEPLEWVAYGPCGHREVCSTCVARLRFICSDRRCCICKTESDTIFVTKALGDYTSMINDFSVFPSNSAEGPVGRYWYHEDTQAYFDDSDHYKMIKAMCRLSCSVCDKMEDQGNDASKRREKFRNIEQLKGHLHHRHRLYMCSLCLEGRKIFICEQKLYTRAQLNQHINTGDSEVDGSETERGGFMGHPMCEFCKNPFYGENELYSHMSTEHFTCHICQRQHPGQYEYYKNYDDLEIHFRHEHFLCESEACLAKKFIVFQSESEMKRHNAIEHGGNMSRSKRNAALQIPISFQYRRSNEQDHRGRGRGRGQVRGLGLGLGLGRGSHPDSSDNQLSLAIQASFETANVDTTNHESLSNTQVVSDPEDAIVGPFDSLATTDSELSLRYLQAVSQSSRNAPLEESSFPPLPMMSGSSKQKPKIDSQGSAKKTMAARLRRHKGSVTVLNVAQAWPAANRQPAPSSSSSSFSRPTASSGFAPLSSSGSSRHSTPVTANGPVQSSYPISSQARPETAHGLVSATEVNSSWNSSSPVRVSYSASAPNLIDRGSLDPSLSNFPPVSATQKHKLPINSQPAVNVKDVQNANKSLVERIRSALEFDENKYTAFKDISAEYRQGVIDTGEYLAYVQQFGLSHLVLELAKLCPDAQKQKELIEMYNVFLRSSSSRENGLVNGSVLSKGSNGSNKGKGKFIEDVADNSSKVTLADSIINTVRKLQSNHKPSEGEVEVLTRDGYRASKGKSKVISAVDNQVTSNATNWQPAELRALYDSQTASTGSNQNLVNGEGVSKQRKKTSKFHRVRLGNGSAAALLDLRHSDPSLEQEDETIDGKENPSEGLPVQGVWKNGGGQRLKAMAQRDPRK